MRAGADARPHDMATAPATSKAPMTRKTRAASPTTPSSRLRQAVCWLVPLELRTGWSFDNFAVVFNRWGYFVVWGLGVIPYPFGLWWYRVPLDFPFVWALQKFVTIPLIFLSLTVGDAMGQGA